MRGKVKIMTHCMNCGTILGDEVEVCPICDARQLYRPYNNINNFDTKFTNKPTRVSQSGYDNTHIDEELSTDELVEIERLVRRAEECFNSGKAWLGSKDRSRARKEFQRAFKYYETILKIDPDNEIAKENRAKCLLKMA
jgi:RNA polymerase subunit RPABC4/transcription elongation factor Spt4